MRHNGRKRQLHAFCSNNGNANDQTCIENRRTKKRNPENIQQDGCQNDVFVQRIRKIRKFSGSIENGARIIHKNKIYSNIIWKIEDQLAVQDSTLQKKEDETKTITCCAKNGIVKYATIIIITLLRENIIISKQRNISKIHLHIIRVIFMINMKIAINLFISLLFTQLNTYSSMCSTINAPYFHLKNYFLYIYYDEYYAK